MCANGLYRHVLTVLAAFAMSACDMAGGGKVAPVIKRGPPAAALESPVDVERVAALVPKDNSYANKTTSVALTIAGTCITDSVAVAVSVANAEISVTLDCEPATGVFSSSLDLSSLPDGEIDLEFGFLKSRTSTAPIYEMRRKITKVTEGPADPVVPATLSESNGTVSIPAVARASLYRGTFTPSGGGDAVVLESSSPSINVSSLTAGQAYVVSFEVEDVAGNKAAATGTATFTKADTTKPAAGAFADSTGVGMTGFTLNWTAATDGLTAQADLEYLVCSGNTADEVDTLSDCAETAWQEMNWTANTLTLAITGKSAATTYHYNVVVRDAAGNMALYAAKSQATAGDSVAPVPGNSGTLAAATDLTPSGFTVSWTAATDDVDDASQLNYWFCQATSAADIDTADECQNASHLNDAMPAWTANATSIVAINLSPGTTYFYNVVVQDQAGNVAMYGGGSATTLADTSAPVLTTGNLTSDAVSSSGFTVHWTAATDDYTAGADLEYRVCIAASSAAVDQLAECTTPALEAMDWTKNVTSFAVTGKSASTTYHFNVVVRDAAGNEALYTTASATTSASGGGIAATLSGTPDLVSTASSLDVTVGGTGVTRYKFAVDFASSISCDNGADYTALDAGNGYDLVSVHITNSLLTDGEYLLCVVGGDDSNNWQGYLSATSFTWKRDTTGPVVGAFLESTPVSDTGFTLRWSAASDVVTSGENIEYYVCRGDAPTDIDTVEKCEDPTPASVDMVMDWLPNGLNTVVSGLTASTTYHYNVIARDEMGNKSLYEGKSQATTAGGGGGGGGNGNYRIYVPYFEGTTPSLAQWEIVGGIGAGSRQALPVTSISTQPDPKKLMSAAISANGIVSVAYPTTWDGINSNAVLSGATYDATLSNLANVTPDPSYSLRFKGVDVAFDETAGGAGSGAFKYFYATHYRFDGTSDGAYTVRVAEGGGTSSEGMPAHLTIGYADVAGRVDSGGKYELTAIATGVGMTPTSVKRIREGDAGTADFGECLSGTPTSMQMAEISRGDDIAVGVNCDTGGFGSLYVSHNKARTGSVVYTKTRDNVTTQSADSNAGITDTFILDDGDVLDLYRIHTGNAEVQYCPGLNCSSPTYVTGTPADGTLQSVRAAKAADGTVFVVVSVRGTQKNKLIFVQKTGATSFATPELYDLAGTDTDTVIGRRIVIEGAPGNSNWAPKYTLFAGSKDHYGNMTTVSDPMTILSPNDLCKGYAFGQRLPRANSAVAVIGDANSSIEGNIGGGVGGISVDVYTNASTPSLLKAAANFLSDSTGPVYSGIFDEAGTQWNASYPVWIGATASNNGVDSCMSVSGAWTNATGSADGEYLDIGGMSQSWFSPPDPNNYTPLKKTCNQTAKILCLIK